MEASPGPGALVDPTIHLALSSPPHASCYTSADATGPSHFSIATTAFFLLLAILLLAVFVADICILIFAIWGGGQSRIRPPLPPLASDSAYVQ